MGRTSSSKMTFTGPYAVMLIGVVLIWCLVSFAAAQEKFSSETNTTSIIDSLNVGGNQEIKNADTVKTVTVNHSGLLINEGTIRSVTCFVEFA